MRNLRSKTPGSVASLRNSSLLLLAASLLLSATVIGCHSKSQSAEQAQDSTPAATTGGQQQGTEVTLPVKEQQGMIGSAQVEATQQPELLHFPGKIVLPDNESWRVGVITTGRVERVYANLGDYVHKGQVLARLHSHDVHEARAEYAMAVAERTRLEAAASLAQTNYDRVQRLYDLRAASVEQTEQARQELVNAKTALENGKTNLNRTREHLEENLGIPAEVAGGQHSSNAELVPVIAPASGYVLQKNITPGTTVAPATDLFVLGDLKHLWMLASVGQEFLSQLKVGQRATVTLPGAPDVSIPGRISNMGQSFDPTTRRLQVRIDLENTSSLLHPEMLANADISAGTAHPVLLVPAEAVQQVNGQDVVFIRKTAERFQLRAVRLGGTQSGKVVLAEGVQAGEEVVTKGSFLLKSQLLKASMQGD